ncbi:MAG: hypothetical protein C0459_08300 [Chitinophaga sp.]|jgi:hypothetical protein|nr:hypothetical protein [Chitinophaga sp.]
MKNLLAFLCTILIVITSKSQTFKKPNTYAFINAGISDNRENLSRFGLGYFRLGFKYQPLQRWSLNVNYAVSRRSDFPKNFTYNSDPSALQNDLLALYIGRKRSDYTINNEMKFINTNIITLQIAYEFRKSGSHFALEPKFGFGFAQKKSFGLRFNAYFLNDIITGGTFISEIQNTDLRCFDTGLNIKYYFKRRQCAYITTQVVTDDNGNRNGALEEVQFGIGYQIQLNSIIIKLK